MVGDEGLARSYFGDRRALCGEYEVIQRALCRREFAVDRKRAGDIRSVAIQFGTGVDQQQVAIAQQRVVGAVVQHAGIGAAGDDRLVTGHGAVFAEGVQQFGFDFVFVHARAHRAHRTQVRLDGDLRTARHHAQFAA